VIAEVAEVSAADAEIAGNCQNDFSLELTQGSLAPGFFLNQGAPPLHLRVINVYPPSFNKLTQSN